MDSSCSAHAIADGGTFEALRCPDLQEPVRAWTCVSERVLGGCTAGVGTHRCWRGFGTAHRPGPCRMAAPAPAAACTTWPPPAPRPPPHPVTAGPLLPRRPRMRRDALGLAGSNTGRPGSSPRLPGVTQECRAGCAREPDLHPLSTRSRPSWNASWQTMRRVEGGSGGGAAGTCTAAVVTAGQPERRRERSRANRDSPSPCSLSHVLRCSAVSPTGSACATPPPPALHIYRMWLRSTRMHFNAPRGLIALTGRTMRDPRQWRWRSRHKEAGTGVAQGGVGWGDTARQRSVMSAQPASTSALSCGSCSRAATSFRSCEAEERAPSIARCWGRQPTNDTAARIRQEAGDSTAILYLTPWEPAASQWYSCWGLKAVQRSIRKAAPAGGRRSTRAFIRGNRLCTKERCWRRQGCGAAGAGSGQRLQLVAAGQAQGGDGGEGGQRPLLRPQQRRPTPHRQLLHPAPQGGQAAQVGGCVLACISHPARGR